MKNNISIPFCRLFYLSLITVLLGSCESFTDTALPSTQLTGEAVFNDAASAEAALLSVYAGMRENGVVSGSSMALPNLMANYSDEMDYYGTNAELEQVNKHMVLASNSVLLSNWNATFQSIYRINAVIQGVEHSSVITGEIHDRLLGEARFLRALNFMGLVSLFGDVPYITSTDYRINMQVPRLPEQEAWEHIVTDLTQAKALLPESYPTSDRVRANKAAATALLARAYLYLEDYQKAATESSYTINSGLYQVPQDLDTAFLKESPSIILSLHSGLEGINTLDGATHIFTSGPPDKPALSQALYNAFENNDLRREHWIKPVTDGSDTWYHAFKYKQNLLADVSLEHSIVLRIEEQYLIRAEALAHLGQITSAQQDLNIIRSRAGLSDTAAATTEDLIEAILAERRFELFTEQGHRWLDLRRTAQAASVLSPIKPGWRPTDLLLPIPENELLLNPKLLPQNPGY